MVVVVAVRLEQHSRSSKKQQCPPVLFWVPEKQNFGFCFAFACFTGAARAPCTCAVALAGRITHPHPNTHRGSAILVIPAFPCHLPQNPEKSEPKTRYLVENDSWRFLFPVYVRVSAMAMGGADPGGS